MPYKFIVAVKSKGFDEAPGVVLRGLGRLAWATKIVEMSANNRTQKPNELLLLGYLENMHIGVCQGFWNHIHRSG